MQMGFNEFIYFKHAIVFSEEAKRWTKSTNYKYNTISDQSLYFLPSQTYRFHQYNH